MSSNLATPADISHAATSLRQGKLVILPTETVYGIALNLLSTSARDAAKKIKSPATPGPWVVHVARPDDISTWHPNLSAIGRRLISKSLPGPVAFQIKLDADALAVAQKRLGNAANEALFDDVITLRCPDFAITQDLLASLDEPIAILGAGTPAHPGIFEPADLPPALTSDPAVAAVLNGGPTRYRRSSTVVRIDGEQYSIVRPGVIDDRILHRMADFTILFLCTGNTCRSPMAAALATRVLADKLGFPPADLPLHHIVIQSAGLHAARGMRATLEAVDAVRELGADLSPHLSQPATPELLRRADVIYTMTGAHSDEVMDLYPWAERKLFRLDPDADIADPIGMPPSVYERVAKRMMELLQKRLSELPV